MAQKTTSWTGWQRTKGGASDGWRCKLTVKEQSSTTTSVTYRLTVTSTVNYGINSSHGNVISWWINGSRTDQALTNTNINGINVSKDVTIKRSAKNTRNWFGICVTVANYCPGTQCTSGGDGDCYMDMSAIPYTAPSAPKITNTNLTVEAGQKISLKWSRSTNGTASEQYQIILHSKSKGDRIETKNIGANTTSGSFQTFDPATWIQNYNIDKGGTLPVYVSEERYYAEAWHTTNSGTYNIIVKPKPKFSITTPPSLTTQPATTHVQYATPLTLLWNSGQCQNGTYKNTVISFQLNSLSKNITTSTNKNGQININWNKLLTSKEWPSSSSTSLIIKSITNYTDNDAKAHQYTSQLTLTADPYVEPTGILSIKVQVPDTATAKKIWIKVPDNYKGPSPVKIKLE